MIQLAPFGEADFDRLISWVESKESLAQFAGPAFQFPLTPDQLAANLSDKKRLAFKVIHLEKNEVIGHAEIYQTAENKVRLGRLLIGNKAHRGKGLGEELVKQLAAYSFEKLEVAEVDLNVYDWNTQAIACYEKVGFTLNPHEFYEIDVNGSTWKAVNMVLKKDNQTLSVPELL